MRHILFAITVVFGLVATAALYAQVQLAGPNFWGQLQLQVKPTGLAVYRPLEDWLGQSALSPRAFTDLPTCAAATEGNIAAVNDSITDVWGDPVANGGALHVLAYCNSAQWTVMSK